MQLSLVVCVQTATTGYTEDSTRSSPDLEKAHASNISQLLVQFPATSEDEIRALYAAERAALEKNAIIFEYIPLFVYRKAKELLGGRYLGAS